MYCCLHKFLYTIFIYVPRQRSHPATRFPSFLPTCLESPFLTASTGIFTWSFMTSIVFNASELFITWYSAINGSVKLYFHNTHSHKKNQCLPWCFGWFCIFSLHFKIRTSSSLCSCSDPPLPYRIISIIDHRRTRHNDSRLLSGNCLNGIPRYCIWSKLIDVITQALGSSTAVVASSLPPRPVSEYHIIHICIRKIHHSPSETGTQKYVGW